MKTVLIRVTEATPDGAYPVALSFDDGNGPVELATGLIPADLGSPPDDDNGQPLPADKFVEVLLGQTKTATFGAIGRYLYGLLGTGGIGQAWRELRSKHRATQDGQEPLLTMFDIRPDVLARLPWELLAASGDDRLFLDKFNPFLRGSPEREITADMPPLRLLLVVGDLAVGEDEAVEILAGLNDFHGTMECQVMIQPSRDELVTAVQAWRPHIFHFTGHAEQPAGSEGYLLLGGAGGQGQLTRETVAIGFQGHAGRLAVLNACRTGAGSKATIDEAREATASMADAFSSAGFPAVIAMQADIETTAAARFGTALYKQLARGMSLPEAVSQARFETWSLVESADRRDWALPALRVSARPDQILTIRDCLAGSSDANRLTKAKEFREISTFVNQYEHRRAAWLAVDPEGFLDMHPKGLVVVHGVPNAGKSWLMYHCLRTCAIRGRMVRLVDFGGERPLTFLDVLRAIKDGTNAATGGSVLREGLPSANFSAFHHAVAQVADKAGAYQPYEPAMGEVADPGTPFDRNLGSSEERAAALIEAFSADLESVATSEPLILALDRLSGVEKTDFKDFITPLLRKLAEANEPRVRVIIAVRPDEVELLKGDLEGLSTTVELRALPKERFGWLFSEYLLADKREWKDVKKLRPAAEQFMEGTKVDSWTPDKLYAFKQLIEAISR